MIEAGFMFKSKAQKKYPDKIMVMIKENDRDENGYMDSSGQVFVFDNDGEEYKNFLKVKEKEWMHNNPEDIFCPVVHFFGEKIRDWLDAQGGIAYGRIPFGEI